MPYSVAGFRVQSDHRIGEQIGGAPARAIKIKRRRSSRDEDDAALLIYNHSGPVVGGPARFPSVWRPGVMAKFTVMRNGVKGPAQFSGAHVVGAHIARRRRQRFGITPSHDDQVFVDNARAGQRDRLLLWLAA